MKWKSILQRDHIHHRIKKTTRKIQQTVTVTITFKQPATIYGHYTEHSSSVIRTTKSNKAVTIKLQNSGALHRTCKQESGTRQQLLVSDLWKKSISSCALPNTGHACILWVQSATNCTTHNNGPSSYFMYHANIPANAIITIDIGHQI